MKSRKLRSGRYFFALVLLLVFYNAHARQQGKSFDQMHQSKPVISSRDSALSLQALRNEIDNVLNEKNLQKSKFGVAIYSLTTGKYYYQKNIDLPLTPASNTKLVTAFVALKELGKDFKVKTIVYSDSRDIRDSVLNGNLYIYGRGDPFLSINNIEQLADAISGLGIKNINGNIYADGSFFDNKKIRKDYSGDADHVENIPPITAICFEKNTATVLVTTGSKLGNPVNVQIIPPSPAFTISNTAKIANKGKIAVASNMSEGKQNFLVSGSLAANRTYSYRYYINNPELAVAGAFKQRLEAGGIKIKGDFGTQELSKLDSNKRIFKLAEIGRDVKDIIYPVLKNSDNFLAEMLFKLIGAESGKLSDNASGTKAITKKVMEKFAIPFEACMINDGSGLSRRNLLTARTLIHILKETDKLDFRSELDSCLAVAGIDGTLSRRMAETSAYENLRAKTGTLRNASSLAGYVNTIDGERLAFAFIFNGNAVWYYKQAEAELGRILSQFFFFNSEN